MHTFILETSDELSTLETWDYTKMLFFSSHFQSIFFSFFLVTKRYLFVAFFLFQIEIQRGKLAVWCGRSRLARASLSFVFGDANLWGFEPHRLNWKFWYFKYFLKNILHLHCPHETNTEQTRYCVSVIITNYCEKWSFMVNSLHLDISWSCPYPIIHSTMILSDDDYRDEPQDAGPQSSIYKCIELSSHAVEESLSCP